MGDPDPDKSTANPQHVSVSYGESNVQSGMVCRNWALKLALWFRALSPISIS